MKIIQNVRLFPSLIVLIRVLFGIGWLLAGVTKITEKLWFKEPGIFLKGYLINSLQNSNTSTFYKTFIENIALEHLMVLNYVIPIVQVLLGLFLIVGLLTIPSILVCLFMHINFILSGNMNLISLILYTSAFSLLIFRSNIYHFSLDKYFNLDILLARRNSKRKTGNCMPLNKGNLFGKS
ncbi:DoxX family membrane protein [Alteribacillus bidgolensis]|uniref:Thiosulfate dehydrogenase [quinone] large subunit n=1 Tax=Alteribacillus bidgolensis TaxID=930129 RepID=A0A1G8LSX1_9BACI|nr:DoxX family membrane protein [Alteribacillus bidgolensis]SDI58811.1 thiosulfate dehydrogenase [quinone] large subunit [Alteribacillus bidgolensis]